VKVPPILKAANNEKINKGERNAESYLQQQNAIYQQGVENV